MSLYAITWDEKNRIMNVSEKEWREEERILKEIDRKDCGEKLSVIDFEVDQFTMIAVS